MNSHKYIACTTGMYTNEGETYEKDNTHKRVGLKRDVRAQRPDCFRQV